MKFFSLTHKRVTEFAPTGSPIRETFELKIEPDGNRHLVKTGEENLYEIIQSFESQCNIENIVRRFENGDLNALNRVQGFYIDSTLLPTNLHEANQLLNKARDIYSSFPVDAKKRFPTFDDFISNFSSVESINTFINSLAPNKNINKNNIEKEVLKDEQKQ